MVEDKGLEVDLRSAIEALRRRTQQYQLLAEQAADGVLLVTSGGRMLNVNVAAGQILGYARDDLLRMHFSDLLAADQRGEDPMALLRLAPGEKANRERALNSKRDQG